MRDIMFAVIALQQHEVKEIEISKSKKGCISFSNIRP